MRTLTKMEEWSSSVARSAFNKIVSGRPVLQEEANLLGEQTISKQTLDGSIEMLLDADYRRRIISWVLELQLASERGDNTLADRMLQQKPQKLTTSRYVHISEGLEELSALAAEANTGRIVKMPFSQVRNVIGDLGPGSLHVIAGPPGSLKSGFTEQFDIAVSKKYSGGVFSLEMVRAAKLARYAQHLYGETVGPRAIQTGLADITLLAMAKEKLRTLQLHIDDKPDNIIALIDAMELMEQEQSPDYYSVDYLQLLNPLPGETDYQSVKNNVKQIYHFAKRHNKPVILLSQLNRESRKDQFAFNTGKKIDKTPNMTDLEGAGTIEQVAHSITFLMPVEDDPDVRRVYVAKNRNGQSPYDFGNVPVWPEKMDFRFDIEEYYKR